jgi:hypothetical protein
MRGITSLILDPARLCSKSGGQQQSHAVVHSCGGDNTLATNLPIHLASQCDSNVLRRTHSRTIAVYLCSFSYFCQVLSTDCTRKGMCSRFPALCDHRNPESSLGVGPVMTMVSRRAVHLHTPSIVRVTHVRSNV